MLKKRYEAALEVVNEDPNKLIVAPGRELTSSATNPVQTLELARRN
mgnify:FL=1